MKQPKLTIVKCDGEHLEQAHGTPGDIHVNHINGPAFRRLAAKVEDNLGQILDASDDKLQVGEVVNKIEPTEVTHDREDHENSTTNPDGNLQ